MEADAARLDLGKYNTWLNLRLNQHAERTTYSWSHEELRWSDAEAVQLGMRDLALEERGHSHEIAGGVLGVERCSGSLAVVHHDELPRCGGCHVRWDTQAIGRQEAQGKREGRLAWWCRDSGRRTDAGDASNAAISRASASAARCGDVTLGQRPKRSRGR